MAAPKSPCIDCTERTITCHIKNNCEKWEEYLPIRKAWEDKVKQERAKEKDLSEYKTGCIKKRRRKK